MTRLFLSFGVGILFSSSWISPSGHSHPQMVRPSTTPKSSMMPSTYQPALWPVEASAFWIDPSGHAPAALGQE